MYDFLIPRIEWDNTIFVNHYVENSPVNCLIFMFQFKKETSYGILNILYPLNQGVQRRLQ